MPRRHPRPVRRTGSPPPPDPVWAAERERRARAACAAKTRYDSEDDARVTALMHTPGRGPRPAPYRCEICGAWHLTSRAAR